MDALNVEAREMALNIVNGNRSDVREFITEHQTPAKLVLAIVRHLGSLDAHDEGFASYLDAVVNMQSLLERVDV